MLNAAIATTIAMSGIAMAALDGRKSGNFICFDSFIGNLASMIGARASMIMDPVMSPIAIRPPNC